MIFMSVRKFHTNGNGKKSENALKNKDLKISEANPKYFQKRKNILFVFVSYLPIFKYVEDVEDLFSNKSRYQC